MKTFLLFISLVLVSCLTEVKNTAATDTHQNLRKDTMVIKTVVSNKSARSATTLSLPYGKNKVSYEWRLMKLKENLERAAQDSLIDSFKSIHYGRLIESGSLAIALTKEYKERFGQNERITTGQYQEISNFLFESKLSSDLNQLFKPYRKTVKRVSIEKVFFTPKDELMRNSKVEQDSSLIPEKILDATIWIELEDS